MARARPFTQGPCTLSVTVEPRKVKIITPMNSTSRETMNVLLVIGCSNGNGSSRTVGQLQPSASHWATGLDGYRRKTVLSAVGHPRSSLCNSTDSPVDLLMQLMHRQTALH